MGLKMSANVRNLLTGKNLFTKQDILNQIAECIDRGESQKQMASRLGISDAYLSDIRRGSRGAMALSQDVAEKMGYDVLVIYTAR